ncbi:MAG: alpha/beta hydrolase-fold protein, partial [Acidobacteriota bacterium]
MPLVAYGHYGQPVLMLPTAAADFLEYERFQLIDSVKGFVDGGKAKVYSINSVNRQALLNESAQPSEKIEWLKRYDSYITEEVLPLIRQDCDDPHARPIVVGISLGAYLAANTFFKHADLFGGSILLSGSYDCVDRIVLNAYFGMGHSPGGFRVWWRALTGSDQTLDDAHLMRLAGRFSRRVRGYAKAHDIPVVDCTAGQRKHELAEAYLAKTTITEGLFLVLVGRAQAPVWHVTANHHLEKKRPYVNHYSFHILDRDWGHITIKISGHPPFPAQIILNGHEYVACQARKAGIAFTKEDNCFTAIADMAGLAKIAETLSERRAVGRLSRVCERWIYRSCLCFALDFEEQERSGFRYHFSNFQMEYSRNLMFSGGRRMEQVFQALIDRSRAQLDLKTIKTILGDKGRPKYRPRNMRAAGWEVAVERPTYDLTVFKLHCGKVALKIYSKGERVLRIEAVAHNVREFRCGRVLDKFPEIVGRLKGMLERFMEVLSCIDQCFIGDEMLESLPLPSRVGKSIV